MRTRIRPASARVTAAFGIVGLIVFLAAFGPMLAPQDPLAQHPDALQQGISHAHWLGTDMLGRDVCSRLLAGSTVSVLAAVQSVAIALALGVIPGLLSVLLGRGFEWISLRLIDTMIALPFLVFAIAMTALLGNGLVQAMFAVGVLMTPGYFRVTRAAALSVARASYVEAAVLMGATTPSILRWHVWTKVAPAVAVATASYLGTSLAIVASLTFLGIGVVPPAPTWGGLLATDLKNLYDAPFAPVVPAALIVGAVWALNTLADALRDADRLRGAAGRSNAPTGEPVPA